MPVRRSLRALAVAVASVLVTVAVPAAAVLLTGSTASAAERTVSGGRLDWGVKASFQRYVTGPVADGSWSLRDGAATVGESGFRFHSAQGSYDPDTGALRAAFSGGVRFLGHRKPGGTHELDLTIGNPTVRIGGSPAGSGTLHADMRSKDKASGKVTERRQVPLASLDLSGVNMRGGTTPVALTRVPATLTAEGATAFAGYYSAGTPLDPLTLSVDVRPGAPGPGGHDKPSKKPEDTAGAEPAPDEGRFADAAVDWGVRRTFREFVTGPVAEGRWKLSAGARDGGAVFRFGSGKGSYDLDARTLDADFAGGVHFTGKNLDLRLTGVSVRLRGAKGTLLADGTPLVTFDAEAWKPRRGLLHIDQAPSELTRQGAEFFGSTYSEGTAMAPVSVAVALRKDTALPALPDLGSGAGTPAASPSATPAEGAGGASPAASDSDSASTSGSSSAALPVSLAAGSLVVMGAAFWFVRRRRTATVEDNSKEQQTR